MIIILDLKELNHMFQQGLFFPINSYVPFEEIVITYLQEPKNTYSSIWALMEDNQIIDFSKLSDSLLKAIELMSELFHEKLIEHTKVILGENIDDIAFDIGIIDKTAFFLRI